MQHSEKVRPRSQPWVSAMFVLQTHQYFPLWIWPVLYGPRKSRWWWRGGRANFPETISLLLFEVSQNWLETAPVSSTAQAAESTFRTWFSKSLIFLSNYQPAFHDLIPKMRKNNDGRLGSRCSPCKALKFMPEFVVRLAQLRQRWPELLDSKQSPPLGSAILSSWQNSAFGLHHPCRPWPSCWGIWEWSTGKKGRSLTWSCPADSHSSHFPKQFCLGALKEAET